MAFKPLVIDTDQTKATGLFTLYTPDGYNAFTFETVGDVIGFCFMWYDDRRYAAEAYTEYVREMETAVMEAAVMADYNNNDEGPRAA